MNSINVNEGVPMNTKRPAVITIAAILLVVLSLFVAGLGIASQYGLLGQGFGNRQFVAGQFQNRTFNSQGGFPRGGVPQGGFPQGGFPNDQNNSGEIPNFTPNRQAGLGLVRLFRLIRPVTILLDVILLVLAVVAAFGLFKVKRWGAVLGIIISILLILLTIPGMLRIFSAVILFENLARIILAVAVIVLLLLPSARKAYLPAREDQ
jgi:ABC-type glycerol-3-phosphate transport system permease component